jgi:hypothetical protein
MAEITVTVDWDIDQYLGELVDDATIESIGSAVVEQAKEMIAAGISPVAGLGRFEGYSDSYKAAMQGKVMFRNVNGHVVAMGNRKDPRLEGKNPRPVNLELTGDMLEAYRYRRGPDDSLEVGYMGAPEYAEFHQAGTDRMPARKTVPDDGETFAETIMDEVKVLYSERVSAIIDKSNE